MTFSCPHYDIDKDECWRLKTECVPGRPGCVMRANSRFAVPVEQRIAEAKADTLKKHAENAVCEQPGCPLAEDAGKQKTTTKPRAKTKPRNQRPKSMKPRNQKA